MKEKASESTVFSPAAGAALLPLAAAPAAAGLRRMQLAQYFADKGYCNDKLNSINANAERKAHPPKEGRLHDLSIN